MRCRSMTRLRELFGSYGFCSGIEGSGNGPRGEGWPMNIKEFYDADERRRASEEVPFGNDWHDAGGRSYEIQWVADTGELYAMRDEPPDFAPGRGGGGGFRKARTEVLTVEVIATIADQAKLLELLGGWEQVMPTPDSVAWLRNRLWGYLATT